MRLLYGNEFQESIVFFLIGQSEFLIWDLRLLLLFTTFTSGKRFMLHRLGT